VRKAISILSIATWTGAILIVSFIGSPFCGAWFLGRFDPTLPIYGVCGIVLAAIAGIGDIRWARLASLAWSVPAALWALPGLTVFIRYFLRAFEIEPNPFSLWICFPVILLMISMPVFWTRLCYALSARGLT
jgi:hypothetical protein